MGQAVVIQHAPPEGPYEIATALARAGVDFGIVRSDLGETVPDDVSATAGLVVMGGPMSAGSDEGFATRQAELALVRRALDGRIPILGVCLGAQLLATAAGGRVVAGDGIEIGWAPIELSGDAASDLLFTGLATPMTVLHWHGETYELPEGAVRLASTQLYREQAFRVGPCAWGLQFHLEVDAGAVDAFIDEFPEDAEQSPGGASAIREVTADALAHLSGDRTVLLDRFAELVASQG